MIQFGILGETVTEGQDHIAKEHKTFTGSSIFDVKQLTVRNAKFLSKNFTVLIWFSVAMYTQMVPNHLAVYFYLLICLVLLSAMPSMQGQNTEAYPIF